MAIIPDQTTKNFSIDTPQKKRNRNLAALIIGVLIITGGVIYFGFFGGSSVSPSPGAGSGADALNMPRGASLPGSISGSVNALTPKENQKNATLEALGKTTLENPIFSSKQLDSLNISDKLPITIGVKGRENPFAPF